MRRLLIFVFVIGCAISASGLPIRNLANRVRAQRPAPTGASTAPAKAFLNVAPSAPRVNKRSQLTREPEWVDKLPVGRNLFDPIVPARQSAPSSSSPSSFDSSSSSSDSSFRAAPARKFTRASPGLVEARAFSTAAKNVVPPVACPASSGQKDIFKGQIEKSPLSGAEVGTFKRRSLACMRLFLCYDNDKYYIELKDSKSNGQCGAKIEATVELLREPEGEEIEIEDKHTKRPYIWRVFVLSKKHGQTRFDIGFATEEERATFSEKVQQSVHRQRLMALPEEIHLDEEASAYKSLRQLIEDERNDLRDGVDTTALIHKYYKGFLDRFQRHILDRNPSPSFSHERLPFWKFARCPDGPQEEGRLTDCRLSLGDVLVEFAPQPKQYRVLATKIKAGVLTLCEKLERQDSDFSAEHCINTKDFRFDSSTPALSDALVQALLENEYFFGFLEAMDLLLAQKYRLRHHGNVDGLDDPLLKLMLGRLTERREAIGQPSAAENEHKEFDYVYVTQDIGCPPGGG